MFDPFVQSRAGFLMFDSFYKVGRDYLCLIPFNKSKHIFSNVRSLCTKPSGIFNVRSLYTKSGEIFNVWSLSTNPNRIILMFDPFVQIPRQVNKCKYRCIFPFYIWFSCAVYRTIYPCLNVGSWCRSSTSRRTTCRTQSRNTSIQSWSMVIHSRT